jgi:uncharacterized protein YndB with AHSA1/START domain
VPIVTHSAVVDAAPGALWRLLSDLESWPRWMGAPYASESVLITSQGATAAGTEFVMKGRLKARLFARVLDWLPEQRLAYEIHRSEYLSDRLFFQRAVVSVVLAPEGDRRTRITCTHELTGRGLLGSIYAATLMRPLMQTNVQRIVDGLRAATLPSRSS